MFSEASSDGPTPCDPNKKTPNRRMRRFRDLAESMPQLVWMANSDGTVTYYSCRAAKYKGLEQKEKNRWNWQQSVHPEDRRETIEAWHEAVAGEKAYQIEHRIHMADGSYRWHLSRAHPVRQEDGTIQWFGTTTDIHEVKRVQEALRERTTALAQRATQLRALAGELTLSERRERRRMAQVLHDHLQQLLVGAKLRISMLGGIREAGDSVREVVSLLDEAIRESRSLAAELNPPILHDGGLAAGVKWLAGWMQEKHGLTVDLEIERNLPPVADDVNVLLFESVRELLFNVVKHAHVQSAVVGMRKAEPGGIEITVSDTGIGFDPNRVKKASADGGFGLFSLRERLDLIGGRVEIDSAPGRGSRFVLSVPAERKISTRPSETAPAEGQARSGASPLSSRRSDNALIRVLLADDHVVMREGLRKLLNREPDIEVVGEASDGREAVRQAGKLLPDVILMDMSMPELDGLEATRIIHEKHPGIRIIGLSMFEVPEWAQNMRDAGAVIYMIKSSPPEDLIARIRGSVDQRNRRAS